MNYRSVAVVKREEMTWEPSTKRWLKQYRGKMYCVSCRQLGVEKSKEASRARANAWWDQKKSEIDGQQEDEKPHRNQYESVISTHLQMAEWFSQHGQPKHGQGHRDAAREIEEQFKSNKVPPLLHPLDAPLRGISEAGRWIWQDRLHNTEEVTTGDSIGHHVRAFIDKHKGRMNAGDITPTGWDAIRNRINNFRDFLGVDRPLSVLNGNALDGYHSHLLSKLGTKGNSRKSQKDRMSVALQFTKWLCGKGLIEAPLNLLDKNAFRIKQFKTKNERCSDEEIALLLAAEMSERTRLYILLALNIGMENLDIARLKKDEVDWINGRLRRIRGKTKDRSENVPEVDYLLWPQTFDLLKKHKSRDGELILHDDEQGTPYELVLLNEKGLQLKVSKVVGNGDDEKVSTTDNIRSAYCRIARRFGLTKPFHLLRKTSSSKLDEHEVFGRYAQYFLGHAPNSVAESHYVEPSAAQFDRATKWLGQQFNVIK